jgi:AraC-like DNA-binding protein
MENICAILQKTLNWVGRIDKIPLVLVRELRSGMLTNPQPLLEFYYPVTGNNIKMIAGDRMETVRTGEVIILNAHLGNRGICQTPWSYWCMSFNVHEYPIFEFLAYDSFFVKTQIKNARSIKQGFSRIACEYGRLGPLHDLRLKTAVLGLLLTIWENARYSDMNFQPCSSSIEKALDHIHMHYADSLLQLEHLAATAHLSIDHFGRLFKKEIGVSPIKYLIQYRIDRARELIQRSNLSIEQLAYEVGFCDPLYFSRVFSDVVGQSPLQFRKTC